MIFGPSQNFNPYKAPMDEWDKRSRPELDSNS